MLLQQRRATLDGIDEGGRLRATSQAAREVASDAVPGTLIDPRGDSLVCQDSSPLLEQRQEDQPARPSPRSEDPLFDESLGSATLYPAIEGIFVDESPPDSVDAARQPAENEPEL